MQGIARDVTARKELEGQLRQAQKMEAIGRLAGGIAHDFNNLLTVIVGCSEMISRGAAARQSLGADVDGNPGAPPSSAESLTRQLLIFSRKDVVQPAVIDLNEIVDRIDRMLRRIVGEDIVLRRAPRARSRADQGRSRPDRAGRHEPGRQRPGRDAGGRDAHGRNRGRGDRRGLRGRASGIDGRRVRPADGDRYGAAA